jgi:hypothetical protein
LLLQNNTVYIAFGGAFEQYPFNGWIFGYNADTLTPVGTPYTTNVNGSGAGIWQSGNGLAGDGSAIYAITGNGGNMTTGDFSGDTRGSSFVKIGPKLTELDLSLAN